jgi:trk system potassium uptake protein TrkA
MERFAVIGLGRFGMRLASLLAAGGAEVIAVDNDRELVELIRDKVAVAVCLDCTDEEALRAQGIEKVDVAVVGIGSSLEASSLTTVVLKQLGVRRVIARATTPMHAQILSRIGADDIVNPEHESADRWSDKLLAPRVLERIPLAEGYSMVQVAAPEPFFNKTLEQLNVNKRFNVLVVAIHRSAEDAKAAPTETVISGPGPKDTVMPGDVLTLIGSDEAVADFPTS